MLYWTVVSLKLVIRSCHTLPQKLVASPLALICYYKNDGRGTKPTYIFLVIIPLLVIELKATPNGNPSDDFLLEAEI